MAPPPPEFLELLIRVGPQMLFSILCGGLIGLERELKNKPAGIKTNILICMGATLITSMSVIMAREFASAGYMGDPARLAAQIVPGIGFLGGGPIIQARGTILGLTTAATIWVVAAIGIAIGLGYGEFAVAVSVTVVMILVLTGYFEDRVLGRSSTFACEILIRDPDGTVRNLINQILGQNDLMLDDFDIGTRGEDTSLSLTYMGSRRDNKKFILELWSMAGVKEVRQR